MLALKLRLHMAAVLATTIAAAPPHYFAAVCKSDIPEPNKQEFALAVSPLSCLKALRDQYVGLCSVLGDKDHRAQSWIGKIWLCFGIG